VSRLDEVAVDGVFFRAKPRRDDGARSFDSTGPFPISSTFSGEYEDGGSRAKAGGARETHTPARKGEERDEAFEAVHGC
jgi:hypothetical protein